MRDSSKVALGGRGQQILYEGFIKGDIGWEGSADALWGIYQRWYWVGRVRRFSMRDSSKVILGGKGQQSLYEGFIKGDIGWEGSADSLWGIHQRWHWVGGVSRFSMRDSSKVVLGRRSQQILHEGFINGDIGWGGSGDSLWGIHQRISVREGLSFEGFTHLKIYLRGEGGLFKNVDPFTWLWVNNFNCKFNEHKCIEKVNCECKTGTIHSIIWERYCYECFLQVEILYLPLISKVLKLLFE